MPSSQDNNHVHQYKQESSLGGPKAYRVTATNHINNQAAAAPVAAAVSSKDTNSQSAFQMQSKMNASMLK